MGIDRTNLSVEQVAMLDQHEATQKQVVTLEKALSTLGEIEKLIKETDNTASLKKPLEDITAQLKDLNSKETPETPDYAKPVVGAIEALRKELKASLQVKPPAPQVNVAAPNVKVEKPDFSRVEKIIQTDIPKAFKEAIAGIPEAPENDFTPLLDQYKLMLEKLTDIDTGVRMKPQPGSMKVTNPDGSSIGTTPLPSALIASITTITTAGTRVRLPNNPLTVGVLLEAPSTNSGLVYIGGETVSSTVFGYELQPGQTASVAINNTNLIYVDTSVSGNKIAVLGS